MKMSRLADDILMSKEKISIPFKGKGIKDALNFGFSYVESEDHVVEYVVANPKTAKKILAEIPESVLDPDDSAIGGVWTAKLLTTHRVKENEILFSNNTLSVIVNINLNGDKYAYL